GDKSGSWLVTAALPGESAVAERWLAEPAVAVRAIGAGLRAMHEALPVERCPFSWSAKQRLASAAALGEVGHLNPSSWHEEHRQLGVEEALEVLASVPAENDLVVCHGDACSPNTLIGDDGRWTG